MKRIFFIAVILLLSCFHVFGQISTDEEPVSFRMNIPALQRSVKAQKVLPALDLQTLEQEDIEDGENGIPPRFGYRHGVDYTLDNSGEWTILPDGDKIWRLTIACPDALSINLLYDKFRLPEGAKYFIYSSDRKHSIGAFTSVNNKGDEKDIQGFATGLVYGDQVTLEYYLPNDVKETGVISVAYVVHGYRFIDLPESYTRGYDDSGGCQVNVNCSEGQNWQNEKNAVAMILVNGNRYCTGSLVNTTANDNRPLFLTADHCLGGWANDYEKYDAVNSPNLSHWSFYWHYESPGCANAQPAKLLVTSGAMVVANNGASDFALLRLTEDPRNKTGVTPYYLGWDRSGSPGTGGVGIHHPSGDIKKIATHNITPPNNSNCMNFTNDYGVYMPNSNFWRINWMATTHGYSVTEGGSSGSPLLNSNHRIIGQLYGQGYCPNPNCSNPSADIANYGKFSVSWTGNGTMVDRRKLQPWLDSIGTNTTTLAGTNVIPPGITGPTLVSNVGSAYSLRGAYGASITWTFSSNLYLLITTDGTSVIARPTTSTTYKGGAGWIQAMVNGSPVRYNVWVGKPVISGISGNMSPGTSGSYNYYTAQYDSKAAIPYSGFQWELTPTNGNNFTGATTGSLGILFNNTGNYQLRVRATNANGTGDYYSIRLNTSKSSSSSSASSYQVYPNPVSDELTVSLNTSVSQFSPLSPSSGTPSDYTVYLYNASGAIVMQSSSQGGNDVYLDVSGLSNGIYYLLIDSGNGNKPETHKIIVKH